MKKVIVIGATGSLAEYVIDALKAIDDVALTLFANNKISNGILNLPLLKDDANLFI